MTPPFDWLPCFLGFVCGIISVYFVAHTEFGDAAIGWLADKLPPPQSANGSPDHSRRIAPQPREPVGPNADLIQMLRQQEGEACSEEEKTA